MGDESAINQWFIVSVCVTFGVVLLMDCIWFYVTLGSVYKRAMTRVLGITWTFSFTYQNVLAAIIAYSAVVAVSVYARRETILDSFYNGAFLGAVVYGCYNFTNMAMFGANKWGWSTAFIDTTWGAVVVGTAAVVGRVIDSR